MLFVGLAFLVHHDRDRFMAVSVSIAVLGVALLSIPQNIPHGQLTYSYTTNIRATPTHTSSCVVMLYSIHSKHLFFQATELLGPLVKARK